MKQPLITLPLIRLKGRERERERKREQEERERKRPSGKCFVVVLLDCAAVGYRVEQQSPKCRWLLTGLAFHVCVCRTRVCARVCVCSSRTMESPSLRALGEGQEEVTATFGQMTELPESSSSGSQPPWQVRSVRQLFAIEKVNKLEDTFPSKGSFSHENILILKYLQILKKPALFVQKQSNDVIMWNPVMNGTCKRMEKLSPLFPFI